MTNHYPTPNEVEEADRVQLCWWWRHLPLPGKSCEEYSSHPLREKITKEEMNVLNRIQQRLIELGGISHEASKMMQWVL